MEFSAFSFLNSKALSLSGFEVCKLLLPLEVSGRLLSSGRIVCNSSVNLNEVLLAEPLGVCKDPIIS